MDVLARRIESLERRVRRQRAVTLALLALGALAAGRGGADSAAPPKAAPSEVRARRFALVGADGRSLAALEERPGGGSRLALFGPDETARVALEVDAAGDDARVAVAGPGKGTASLVSDGLAPRLAISDAAGGDRVWVAVRLGSPVVQFLDPRGMARTGLTTFDGDTGVAVISGTDRTRPGLVLLGRDRTVIWSVP